MLDGFYLGYMSSSGYGVVLFIIQGENIVGADAGGVKFDGRYHFDESSNSYIGSMSVSAPPNIELIQGFNTGPDGYDYDVSLTMPKDFTDGPYFNVQTPLGKVNVKLEKIRDLGLLG